MKIATWNVNSIRARLERLLTWLDAHRPDLVCLQELKCTEDDFPLEPLAGLGYKAAVCGQKTYNGVAILSLAEAADVRKGLGDDDPQARLISARVAGLRVFSVYVPNGATVASESYAYKLEWLRRLRQRLADGFSPDQPIALCGDFNVAVDDKDVDRPEEWAETVLCHVDARQAVGRLAQWGLVDVFRKHHPAGGIYSHWDYRNLAFPRNNGLRIDHVFATAPLADRSTGAEIHRNERKGPKPSDHAPVVVTFED